MTRLYVQVRCERCKEIYGADIGSYFGRKLGDKGYTSGICGICKMKDKYGHLVDGRKD